MSAQHHALNRSLLMIVCKTEATGNMIADRLEELERENAVLREDKARLDSGTIALIAEGGRRCVWYGRDLRAAIDAARKEART